jgi:hypothetical protein
VTASPFLCLVLCMILMVYSVYLANLAPPYCSGKKESIKFCTLESWNLIIDLHKTDIRLFSPKVIFALGVISLVI